MTNWSHAEKNDVQNIHSGFFRPSVPFGPPGRYNRDGTEGGRNMSRKRGMDIVGCGGASFISRLRRGGGRGAGFRARDRDLFRSFRAACIPVLSRRPAPAAVGRGDFLPKYRGIVFGHYAGAA